MEMMIIEIMMIEMITKMMIMKMIMEMMIMEMMIMEMIYNYIKKLLQKFSLDTIEIKIHLNYLLFELL